MKNIIGIFKAKTVEEFDMYWGAITSKLDKIGFWVLVGAATFIILQVVRAA